MSISACALKNMFFHFCFMKKLLIFLAILSSPFSYSENKIKLDTTKNSEFNLFEKRLQFLNNKTPMDLCYNEKVQQFIDSYLGRNKALISRMQALKGLYFPLFEQQLDKYQLPLELKYLAIVESALNPRAKSPSGATGLWQFMYLTGKDYGLEVTSYTDERQDPLKSTQAACEYFIKLFDLFGDWNLVLAAYNGGPGYLQRKINSVGSYDFWQLYPHLRKETRNYIPTFIAVNYVMNYSEEHKIYPEPVEIYASQIDTLTIKTTVEINTIVNLLCVNKETINYLNPSCKDGVFPSNSNLTLPLEAVQDFLNNEEASYLFIEAVELKDILIDEERIVYVAVNGDYLGRIAKQFGVRVYEIKKWNNLTDTNLDIGDELIIYVKKDVSGNQEKLDVTKTNYIIQPGDTLWDIAQKHEGLSVWKIKSLNNMKSDKLKPGTKILLPNI